MTIAHYDHEPPPDDGYQTTPADHAEQAILGALLLDAPTDDAPPPSDYRHPGHELIAHTIQAMRDDLKPVDTLTVADALGARDLLRLGGLPYLHELITKACVPASIAYYRDIITEAAGRRRLATLGTQLQAAAQAPGDLPLAALLHDAAGAIDNVAATSAPPQPESMPGLTIDNFLAGTDEDDDYDWLVPGLLERTDRLILTAPEGVGKSTLLRQWGIQIAAGIHPVTNEPTPPARVLILDLENSKKQTRRKLRPLHAKVAHQLQSSNLIVHCKTEGIDLTTDDDRTWLDNLLAHHQPDLLITGPIYKMATGNPNDEQDSKPVAMHLDAMRARHGITLLLEAHPRKGEGGKKRPMEPYGWSGWMRWPEFGIFLSEEGDLQPWRGMRDERLIPHVLQRGGEWPWMPVVNLAEQRWIAIKAAVRTAGKRLSVRELEVATRIPKSSIQEILDTRRHEFNKCVFDAEAEATK